MHVCVYVLTFMHACMVKISVLVCMCLPRDYTREESLLLNWIFTKAELFRLQHHKLWKKVKQLHPKAAITDFWDTWGQRKQAVITS